MVDLVEDEVLWSRVLAGSQAEAAYADLYRRHADRVFSHCFRMTCHRADSEDLTAETFAEVWRGRERVVLDDQAGLLPWLLGTANNLIRRRRRTLRIACQSQSRLPHEDRTNDHADDVAGQLDDVSDLRQLERVLAGLSPTDREVIHLCVIEGLTPTAVAQFSGENPGAVRTRLSRALQRARAAFQHVQERSYGAQS